MPEPLAASPPGPWVLRLYPRRWRARYGDELAALLAGQKMTFAIWIDLLGGALDARLSPQRTTLDPGAEAMQTSLLSTCSTAYPKATVRQSLIAAGLILLVSLVLSTAHVLLKEAYGPLPAVDALKHSLFPILMLQTTSTLYMQQRSWRAQVAFVGFFGSIIYLILLLGSINWG